jgi:hypothetical protein
VILEAVWSMYTDLLIDFHLGLVPDCTQPVP